MAEIKWDIKRGYSSYVSVTTNQLGVWIREGRIKKGEILVWRSGLGSFQPPENCQELKSFFAEQKRQDVKRFLKRRAKPKIHQIQKICIIDDEVELGDFLAKLLREKNYEAQAFGAPQKALQFLKKEKSDLILLDEKMGNISGVKLLPKIKKLNPRASIVMISAYGNPELRQEAFVRGAVGFVDKPFSLDKILKTIQRLSLKKPTKEEGLGWREMLAV